MTHGWSNPQMKNHGHGRTNYRKQTVNNIQISDGAEGGHPNPPAVQGSIVLLLFWVCKAGLTRVKDL